MIKCLHALFCKECRVEDDGLITLASIYSGFSRRDMPANVQLCFVCFIELSLKEYEGSGIKDFDFRVIASAPWGATISDTRLKIPFRKVSETIARSTPTIQYGEVIFMEFGQYSFDVFVNEEHLYTATLDIVQETES